MIRRLVVPPLEALRPFLPQQSPADTATRQTVARILQRVGTEGDRAVQALTLELDGLDLSPASWEVPRTEWVAALDRLPGPLGEALELAVHRVRSYHERQRDPGFTLTEPDGTILGMKVTPLDRVGLYVPGGKASYPSSVIMNAVPAVVAGVRDIIAVTPPGGFLTDAVLAACLLAGVTRLFRIGGAQAVAALAYGTETVPRVDKIVGPGSRWVAEAKRQVVGMVGIDSIAGPTELLVIADDSTDAARVAADLIAQAEHDEDASAWCVTTSDGTGRRAAGSTRSGTPPRPTRGHRARLARAERHGDRRADDRRCHRRRQPASARAPRDPGARPRHRGGQHPSRRRHLPRAASRPSRWATTSPARATSCRPAARRAMPPRSGSTTSSSARASSSTARHGSQPTHRTSSRWPRRSNSLDMRKR